MLLSKQAQKALIGYNPISSRIISARFDAVPFKITVIHAYAPTSSSSEEDIEAAYNHVEDALAKTDKEDIIILTGDWNAKERGERLLEFAKLHNLFISNTRFQQKSNRKWAWASPDSIHKNMIDLILIQQRWKTSLINCRTFQSADVNSDHSLVMCNIKLRLKKLNNKPQQSCRVDVKRPKNEKLRQSHSTTLTKNLENIKPTCNLEQQATKIEEAIKKAVEETVPVTRTARKP